jgi:hypothetical protein
MVYGVISTPLHRRLPFEGAVAAFVVFSVFLFGLVKLKDWATKDDVMTSKPEGLLHWRWR